jgi:hypothetical protein
VYVVSMKHWLTCWGLYKGPVTLGRGIIWTLPSAIINQTINLFYSVRWFWKWDETRLEAERCTLNPGHPSSRWPQGRRSTFLGMGCLSGRRLREKSPRNTIFGGVFSIILGEISEDMRFHIVCRNKFGCYNNASDVFITPKAWGTVTR